MKIGLFLDIDNTLTLSFVQKQYAQALGAQVPYHDLEARFQAGALDEDTFGAEIVAIFAAHGLTEERAGAIARDVRLRELAPELLALPQVRPVDVHLVSSGPSYFVNHLVRLYPHLRDHVIDSTYTFDPVTHLIAECDAVSAGDKRDFVAGRTAQYRMSVGLGDDPRFDGPFLEECTVPLLLAVEPIPEAPYPQVEGLGPLLRLVDDLIRSGSALDALGGDNTEDSEPGIGQAG
jgi:hypothetical protein